MVNQHYYICFGGVDTPTSGSILVDGEEIRKLKGRNAYANSLLIGNVTGKYYFYKFYLDSLEGLNLDAFSKDNEDLIKDLKSYFVEYIVSNNERKNTFAERIQTGKSLMRDLSQDLKAQCQEWGYKKPLTRLVVLFS